MKSRLSLEQIEQMRTMVQNGEKPEDIAKHFGIAISSVHNHKAKFKAEGMKFPDLRGQRPSGEVKTKPGVVNSPKPKAQKFVQASKKDLDIVVNGVQIKISGQARSVNINPNGLEVDF